MIRKYDEYGNPLDSDSELVNSYLKDKYFTGDISDNSLQAERETADDRRLSAGIGQGADTIASALSGAKPQTQFYDKLASNADRGVKDIEGRRKSKMDEARFAQEAQKFGREETKFGKEQRLEDPDSPESKVYQNALRGLPNSPFTDDQLRNVTAADKDRVTSVAQLIETAQARKEATAARLAATEKEKKPTEAQFNTGGFARRLEQAEQEFKDLTTKGFNRAGVLNTAAAHLPEGLQNQMTKRQDQAERNFVNATLRRESGAAISPSEFREAEAQYFPRINDGPDVLAQKERNRKQILETLRAAAGPALEKVPLVSRPSDEKKSPKAKQVTQNGHSYTLNEATGEYE